MEYRRLRCCYLEFEIESLTSCQIGDTSQRTTLSESLNLMAQPQEKTRIHVRGSVPNLQILSTIALYIAPTQLELPN